MNQYEVVLPETLPTIEVQYYVTSCGISQLPDQECLCNVHINSLLAEHSVMYVALGELRFISPGNAINECTVQSDVPAL